MSFSKGAEREGQRRDPVLLDDLQERVAPIRFTVGAAAEDVFDRCRQFAKLYRGKG